MDYEELILKTLSAEQLEESVATKIAAFHGLLTREVALKLIAKEKGLLPDEEKNIKISEIEKGARKISLQASIKKIWPIVQYKSGKKSRVIELEDETGSIAVVLWNDDTGLGNTLRSKDQVLLKGAYERNEELHLGHSGTIEIKEKAAFSDLSALSADEYAHVRGYISRIDGFDKYVDERAAKFGFSFYVSDGVKDVQVIIWGKPGRGSNLAQGDEIIIENALEKNGRLELSDEARILTRRKEKMLLGKLEEMSEEDGSLKVKVDGKEVKFDRENGLKFMKVDLASDIMMRTALKLKKEFLINQNIAIRIKETEKGTVVEG
jgi:hypothetical protein